MSTSTSNRGWAGVNGFSIVEVLVALVVLGVGMLGIAGLYVVSLRSSGSAISRMQAVNLASDIADRIRANRDAGTAYELAAGSEETPKNCVTDTCSSSDMAAYDLAAWQSQIARSLPGNPSGSIDVDDSATPATYTIRLQWTEAGNEALSYELRMQL